MTDRDPDDVPLDLSALAPRGAKWEDAIARAAARAHARHAAQQGFAGQVVRMARPAVLLAAAAVALLWAARASAPSEARLDASRAADVTGELLLSAGEAEPYGLLTWAAEPGGER